MIWFLEKHDDVLVCEIRRNEENSAIFEFEIADKSGPKTLQFDSPKELIASYLHENSRLMAEGWRPRANAAAPLV